MENFLLGFSGAERATLAAIVTFLGAMITIIIHGVSHRGIEYNSGGPGWNEMRPTTDGELVLYAVSYVVFFVMVTVIFMNPSILSYMNLGSDNARRTHGAVCIE